MKKIVFTFLVVAFTAVFEYANAQYITITPQSSENVTCNGGSDGAISISVTGVWPPFTFHWSNGAITQDISGLAAGTYSLTVTDSYSYTENYSKAITQPAPFSANFITTADTGHSSGKAVPQVTGGTPPYNYLWSTLATTDSISGLQNGTYSVTVSDSKSCSHSFTFTVGSALGIQDVSSTGGFNIYPNPVSDKLSVVGYSGLNTTLNKGATLPVNEIEITDMLGHTVYHQPVTDNEIAVDVSRLPAGVYFVLLKNGNGAMNVKRFVKE